MEFEGKTFIVVGGGNLGGICNNFIKELLKLNVANIAIFDVADEEACLTNLRSEFPNNSVKYYKVDVRHKAEVEQAFNDVVQHFGQIDVVMNGAGIVNENNIEDCLHINLFGTIYGTQCAIDNMSITKGHKGGYVVNIASVAALAPHSTVPVYCASKHAVLAYTRAHGESQLRTAHGMKFITICPGLTITTLVKSMRKGTYTPELQPDECKKYFDLPKQTSEKCAQLMIEALAKPVDTTVWIIDDSKLSAAEF